MPLWKQHRLQDQIGWVADKVRRRAGRGLEVEISRAEVRRGDTVEATVTASEAGEGDEPLEVGLVCTETYADFMPSSKLSVSDKRMLDAVAFEHWTPVSDATQTLELEVPTETPYSYEGEHLRFQWHVCARRQRRGLDAVARQELRVLP